MADYQKMYSKLFNTISDAVNILQHAQSETEEIYIEQEPINITLPRPDSNDSDGNQSQVDCPFNGDIENDCADCIYSGDYHFQDGECIRRSDIDNA